MKKNIIYLAMGIVFLIFAVCIGYVFTEPTKTTNTEHIPLQEQNATLLQAEEQTALSPSADSLIFSAQDNTNTITTPPAPKTIDTTNRSEIDNTSLTNTSSHNKEQITKTEKNIKNPTITSQNTNHSETNSKNSVAKDTPKEDNTKQQLAVIENKPQPKTIQQEAKPAPLQDKLPVAFVEDSLKTRSILSSKKKLNTIIYAELMMDGNQVGLVFEGDKPIKPKTFRLNNPDRVVVDIEGYWVLKLPRLISNRMVKEIRSNAQKDKTRIVFDLKVPVSSSLLYRIHSRKYQLVFK